MTVLVYFLHLETTQTHLCVKLVLFNETFSVFKSLFSCCVELSGMFAHLSGGAILTSRHSRPVQAQ